jgi:hypothetical protein
MVFSFAKISSFMEAFFNFHFKTGLATHLKILRQVSLVISLVILSSCGSSEKTDFDKTRDGKTIRLDQADVDRLNYSYVDKSNELDSNLDELALEDLKSSKRYKTASSYEVSDLESKNLMDFKTEEFYIHKLSEGKFNKKNPLTLEKLNQITEKVINVILRSKTIIVERKKRSVRIVKALQKKMGLVVQILSEGKDIEVVPFVEGEFSHGTHHKDKNSKIKSSRRDLLKRLDLVSSQITAKRKITDSEMLDYVEWDNNKQEKNIRKIEDDYIIAIKSWVKNKKINIDEMDGKERRKLRDLTEVSLKQTLDAQKLTVENKKEAISRIKNIQFTMLLNQKEREEELSIRRDLSPEEEILRVKFLASFQTKDKNKNKRGPASVSFQENDIFTDTIEHLERKSRGRYPASFSRTSSPPSRSVRPQKKRDIRNLKPTNKSFFILARYSTPEAIKYLYELNNRENLNLNINYQNLRGETALMEASKYKRDDNIEALLNLGVDSKLRNHRGLTARDIREGKTRNTGN